MRMLLTTVLITILLVGTVAYGQVANSSEDRPNIREILTKAVASQGKEYVRLRGELLKAGKSAEAQKELNKIAGDKKAKLEDRLLARVSLLRITDQKKVVAFYNNLSEVASRIIKNLRIWQSRVPARQSLSTMRPSDSRALGLPVRVPLPPKQKEKRLKPIRFLRSQEMALFAECLIWHSDASLEKELGWDQPIKKEEFKGVPAMRGPWSVSKGEIAKACVGWFLVLKGEPESVSILEAWGKREPTMREFAMWDLLYLLDDTKVDMPIRRNAVFAYARVGGKSAQEWLNKLAKGAGNPEEIRKAAREAIQQLKDSESGATKKE